jgi:shikimate kinase
MRIVLIGFMATGKSSVAPKLAKRLGLEVVEMDDLIVKKAGKSIKDIFDDNGEGAFRALETEAAEDLRTRDSVVISTGGGVVTSPAAMSALAESSLVVELTGSFETLLKRISPEMPRPLFGDAAQAKALYERRQPLYTKYANGHVDTDGKSIDEVVKAIFQCVNQLRTS